MGKLVATTCSSNGHGVSCVGLEDPGSSVSSSPLDWPSRRPHRHEGARHKDSGAWGISKAIGKKTARIPREQDRRRLVLERHCATLSAVAVHGSERRPLTGHSNVGELVRAELDSARPNLSLVAMRCPGAPHYPEALGAPPRSITSLSRRPWSSSKVSTVSSTMADRAGNSRSR